MTRREAAPLEMMICQTELAGHFCSDTIQKPKRTTHFDIKLYLQRDLAKHVHYKGRGFRIK